MTPAPTRPYNCVFCGAPSWLHPADQAPPADYCGEMHHGDPEVELIEGEEAEELWERSTRPGDLR